jgi:UDP-N-acetylmuramate dehydrogenase
MIGSKEARPFDPLAVGTEIQRRLGVKTSRDEPLARFTTMRVGGPADLFAVAHNAFELRGLVKFARTRGLPHTLLGRGSYVVISDAGIRGLTIQDRAEGLEIREDHAIAEAGLPMARAATETQRAGLSGLEFGLAIPGTVGGAVWANAGAHEADIAGVLESALVLLADGTEATLDRAAFDFGYRHSRLKGGTAPGAESGTGSATADAGVAPPPTVEPPGAPALPEIVISATFQLVPADAETIRRRLDDIKHWRQAHQPLGIPSAGSFFRNPPGDRSAGELIDAAGLKEYRVGGASVSAKHANFLVNDGRGSASDVRRLAEHVRRVVADRFGIELRYEVVFLGDWRGWEGGR